jgi:PEP-CTERM motif-containing protein
MNMKLVGAAGAAVFMNWVSPAPAGIVTLYDNLGATTSGGIGLPDIPFQSFSTGKYAVTSLQLNVFLTGVADFSDFTVALTSDKSGAPNPAYIDYQIDSISSLPRLYFFFFNDPLSADTRYWIVVGGPTSAQWAYASNFSGGGVAGELWGVSSGSDSGGPLQMQVLASVPEPSACVMMLLGFAGLGFAGYRRAGPCRDG